MNIEASHEFNPTEGQTLCQSPKELADSMPEKNPCTLMEEKGNI